MQGIYKITNKENGKVYIGQSQNIERRISEHKKERYIPIDMWINFLGKENFTYEILEECSTEEIDKKEQEYIEKYDSIKNGYNKQNGGYNNSTGEGNGRALLTEEDVIQIRTAYANHTPNPKKYYETYFSNKITLNQFQAVWQGRSWSNIMPEVFTPENKQFYVSEQNKVKATLTQDEVLKYRVYYVNHTYKETYQKFKKENGELLKENTFKKILMGDVRENSIYKEVPIYKKKKKYWELNGEPVSTISGAGE